MLLNDLNIGDKFTVGKGKTVWVKKTNQGMNNAYSYCESADFKNTRNPSQKTKWERLFKQDTKVNKHEF